MAVELRSSGKILEPVFQVRFNVTCREKENVSRVVRWKTSISKTTRFQYCVRGFKIRV